MDGGDVADGPRGVGRWALLRAVRSGNPVLVDELLRAGFDPDAAGAATPPIRIAVDRGEASVVRQLLQHGALVDRVSGDGWTALTAADAQGNALLVELLLANGADPTMREAHGYTALHRAVIARDEAEVASLLEDPATDPEAADAAGVTPLQMAAAMGAVQVVRMLLDRGADVNRGPDGWSPLALAAYAGSRNDSTDLVDLLLERGASIDPGGWPPTFMAVNQEWSSASMLRRLIEAGASIDVRDKDGETVLHRIAQIAGPDLAAVALDLGADIEARDQKGRTPYLAAAFNDGMHQFLAERGADTTARDAEGESVDDIRRGFVSPLLPAFEVPDNITVEATAGDALRFRGDRDALAALIDHIRALSLLDEGAEVSVGSWRLRVSDRVFHRELTTVSLPPQAWNIAASKFADVVWAYQELPFDFGDCGYLSPRASPDIGIILEGPPFDR